MLKPTPFLKNHPHPKKQQPGKKRGWFEVRFSVVPLALLSEALCF